MQATTPLLSSGFLDSMPGRVTNENIFVTKIGPTQMYFYMTEEKLQAAQKVVKKVNQKKLSLVVDAYTSPPTTEIAVVASIFPNQNVDLKGQKILDNYLQKTKEIAERIFGISIFGETRELNLVVSHDAHTFHQDCFPAQYKYLQDHAKSSEKYALVHDLTLIDWDMAEKTISGTLFHEPEGNSRFLIALLPKDHWGLFSVQAIEPDQSGSYPDPGPAILPHHAVLSPEDISAEETAGSSKGQRISTVLRGLCHQDQLEKIDAKELPIMKPWYLNKDIHYQNGMCLKKLPFETNFPLNTIEIISKDNLDIYDIPLNETSLVGNRLHNLFRLDESLRHIKTYRVIKVDGGFQSFNNLGLNISNDCVIIAINRSNMPPGYKPYQISQDQSDSGFPWIEIYPFPNQYVLKLDGSLFKSLYLTPLIELIFRDELNAPKTRTPCKKLVTKLDFFVFSKE